MKTQQYKHWYYYLPNGTNFLSYEVLISFFRPYFYNAIHFFYSIILEYFNFFLPVVPKCNGPTRPWSSRDMSSWYHTYLWLLCMRFCTLIGFNGNIFPIVTSWFFFLIYGQKWYSMVGLLFQSSYCLTYHLKWYNP